MSEFTDILKNSPDFDNSEYIRGLKEGLDAAQEIADVSDMKLAENPSFDELYRLVSDRWIAFRKNEVQE